MPEYRLYLLGRDNHFEGVVELDCPDDETAMTTGAVIHTEVRRELWRGARLVKIYGPAVMPRTQDGSATRA